ncbi:hypothetical protein GWI33_005350 [Rhynchophorus ferrugineus]|uniref:THAP4-like heme-binding domain-containing protein n=1 Tax=Rhynchophorus ferrugineus TaxID=354439 RepID=A0A834IWD9_RHYFE|nr:hypothetical protein GWI33_005350 [Rhynchophorus ferrugineus]
MDILHGDNLLNDLKNRPPDKAVEPIEWIIGKWHSVIGEVMTPEEELEHCCLLTFTSHGQPALNFSAAYWDPETKNIDKFENGFLRVEPGTNKMSFIVSHSNGLSSLEEGELINPHSFKVKGKKLIAPSGIKRQDNLNITSIERQFLLESGNLNYSMNIETDIPFHTYEFTYLLKKISH